MTHSQVKTTSSAVSGSPSLQSDAVQQLVGDAREILGEQAVLDRRHLGDQVRDERAVRQVVHQRLDDELRRQVVLGRRWRRAG